MTVIRNTLTHKRAHQTHAADCTHTQQSTVEVIRDFSSSISSKDAELSITAHTRSCSACKLMGKQYNEALKMSLLPLI